VGAFIGGLLGAFRGIRRPEREVTEREKLYRQFQLDPSPVVFSTRLAERPELHQEIIEIIKAGPPGEYVPYIGQVDHAAWGRLEWMIYVLPVGGPWDIHLAMSVRLYEEFWVPGFLDRTDDR
jgi:hypothetical protein